MTAEPADGSAVDGTVGHRRPRPALVAVAAYLVVVAAALPVVGDHLNPDGSAYISMARRWLAGDVGTAVSGYWGPLLSWLTAPLLAAGVGPIGALRTVLVLGGVAQLLVVDAWLDRLRVAGVVRWASLVAAAALTTWHALYGGYPEVLLNTLLLAGALRLSGPATDATAGADGRAIVRTGVVGGLLLGAAYLAKSVGLLLGAGTVVAVAASCARRPAGHRAHVLRGCAVAAVTIVAVAVPWVLLLSARQGAPTWTTAGDFNARLVGSPGNPMTMAGLYELPFEEARSPWDDPPALTPVAVPPTVPDDAAVGGDRAGAGTPAVALSNVRTVGGSLARRVAPPLLVAGGVVLVAVRRRDRRAADVLVLAAIALGGGLGYLPLIVIERYLWLPMLVAVVLAGVGLHELRRAARTPAVRGAGTVLAALAAAWVVTGAALAMTPRIGAHAAVDRLAATPGVANALDGAVLVSVATWDEGLMLCVRVDCKYLGFVRDPRVLELSTLRAAGVTHVVSWGDDGDGATLAELTQSGLVEVVHPRVR